MSPLQLLFQGDAVHTAVALILLSMSIAAWFVIFWKSWLLQRALTDVSRCTAAFWQAADVNAALAALPAFDREG
ncbi:MAG: MotA/TolQ/ExbB proton channel family protein, partial [Betaproteobacteria bacterium]|nr:MotA/TolQ/ExbB proton channel family protein [Betaproteobacteria bacterium]